MFDHQNLLNIDYLRSGDAEPEWFGVGFIQLKLSDKHRMHFWHPSLPADVSEEEIHDHRYDFTSTILNGRLHHTVFRFEQAYDGDQEMVYVSCDPEKPAPEQAPVVGRAIEIGGNGFVKGSTYSFKQGEFHQAFATKAVSLLTRSPTEVEFARVIRPLGAASVCPFSNPKPTEELWEIIRDCLEPAPEQIEKPGYHVTQIAKGVLGDASKIEEEVAEFMDAQRQNVSVMGLVELSDLIGAVEAFLVKNHPSISLADLKAMSDVTKRAFVNGRRN